MIYYHLLTYNWTLMGTKDWGFGSCEFPTQEPITTIEQLREAEKRLTLNNPNTRFIVLHFQLLRMESEVPTQAPPTWPTYPKGDELPV